ncbi:hypothetical protein [Rhodococcus sp. IEGM 1330]|uniref:hypothetical protein n=1 Tax=Rhodococcus sp. IEGM 1330 TaxID=3082225 RepID=UPI0029558522|nr:hypothetical protein [Rhodococcus sp. IEGM 1330]MDV8024780.1 hypothetical protein [Rhodococcus sp. IEGM 1330]
MKILSINAWGGAMYDELSAWLKTVDAKVFCLQEVTRTPHRPGWAGSSIPGSSTTVWDVDDRPRAL